MRLIALLTLALLLPMESPAHPLHLSITNITYENGKLNIRMKSFRDDWETGYFHYHSKPIDFNDPVQREIPWFSEYMHKKFRITVAKEMPGLSLEIDSVYVEEEAMTIEMHAVVPFERPRTRASYQLAPLQQPRRFTALRAAGCAFFSAVP